MVLRHMKPLNDLGGNKSTTWGKYIDKFFEKSVKMKVLKTRNVKSLLVLFLYSSSILSKNAQSVIKTKKVWNTVKIPTGYINTSLQLEHKSIVTYWYNKEILKKTFIFKIDVSLRLNLTFHTFYIYSYIQCAVSFLSIMNYTLSTDYKRETYNYMLKKSSKPLCFNQFCGHYSSFNYYPKFTHLRIDVRWFTKEQPLLIKNSFTVIEKDLVETIDTFCGNSMQQKIHNLKIRISSKFPMLLQIFFLKVLKSSQINIGLNMFNLYSCVIFDGPGFSSSIIASYATNKNTFYYITSSFQSIVQVLTSYVSKQIIKTNFCYSSVTISSSKLVHIKSTQILKFSDKKDRSGPIVLKIHARSRNHVNITIVELNSKMYLVQPCTYGGLHVENFSSKFKEGKTICDESALKRNFYFDNQSLTVVIYWYKRYTNISVSLHISQTSCKYIHADPCVIAKCYIEGDYYHGLCYSLEENIYSQQISVEGKTLLVRTHGSYCTMIQLFPIHYVESILHEVVVECIVPISPPTKKFYLDKVTFFLQNLHGVHKKQYLEMNIQYCKHLNKTCLKDTADIPRLTIFNKMYQSQEQKFVQ